MTTARIVIPSPVGLQPDVLADFRRFKVVRAGRRGGKTRLAFISGVAGHKAEPNGKGMLGGQRRLDDGRIETAGERGGEILWVPPTIPQSRAIWREELEPRFIGKPGFTVSQTERRVVAPNGGSFEIISGEAIDNARGRRFDGAIIDEAREMDLEKVFDSVVRPTLIDRQGWCLFISSTKAGSRFNELCTEVLEGLKNPNLYAHYHWRTRDNPTLSAKEIEEVYGEYVGREHVAQEELDALLLTGIAGLAFPEYVDDPALRVHAVPDRALPQGWHWVAGMDWGYVKGAYLLGAIGPEGHLEIVWEHVLQRTHAKEAAKLIWMLSAAWPRPSYIACDQAMWADTGLQAGATIADEFLEGLLEVNGGRLEGLPRMLPMKKGPGSRVAGKNHLHRLLAYRDIRHPDTKLLEPWAAPRVRIQAKCHYLRQSMRTLPLDEKNPEDVDTKADDHGYDGLRYLAASLPEAPPLPPDPLEAGRHPGYDPQSRRRREHIPPWEKALRGEESLEAGYDNPVAGYWHPGMR